MAKNNKKNTDDFFAILAQDEQKGLNQQPEEVANPFDEEEIIFRDETGQLKVLKDGKVESLGPLPEVKKEPEVSVSPQPVATTPPPILDISAQIAAVVSQSGLKFDNADLTKRFEDIIASRLKGRRDAIQTREVLIDLPQSGGLGLPDSEADRVLQIIENELVKLDDNLRIKAAGETNVVLQQEADKILGEAAVSPPPKLLYGISTEPQSARPISKSAAEMAPAPTAKPLSSQRPKIEDVRFRPRLLGPIEEIRSLTLVDFRRLASSPGQVTENILAKIKLLEKDSFTNYIEGIKAWKESEVNQLYLDIGHESMAERLPVDQIVKSRQASGQPTLSQEEFDAISDLNQRLRH